MAHESFEDAQVAELLNKYYVSIKVDREERPDIDYIYMMYCQALTGEGGWPLTVIMTPEGHPFFAGTYFPKTARYGRPGIMDVLQQLHDRWEADSDKLREASQDITARLQPIFAESPGTHDAAAAVQTAQARLAERFDHTFGGFGDAPKFPSFHQPMFLLRHFRYTGDRASLRMVQETLLAITRGGIYDHIGGGLARYSTDAVWRVPHFEKMLYDNALAVITLVETYQQTGDERFQAAATDILDYVLRDMTSSDGAFYAAQDADSEGQEGRFYVWRPEDVYNVLGHELGELYCDFYDITDEGNFEGYSIPNYVDTDIPAFAAARGLSMEEMWTQLKGANAQLRERREEREHPATDDKILTAWNALMIAGLAKAGAAFNDNRFLGAAVRASSFIEENLVSAEGRLLARYRDGHAGVLAYADDYAYLTWAYIEVYQATLDNFYLQRALHWQSQMDTLFWDEKAHGYFLTGHDAEALIARAKPAYDGATPSANSVAAYNLVRLYAITADAEYAERADLLFTAFAEVLDKAPTEHLFMLMGSMLMSGGSTQVVMVDSGQTDVRELFMKAYHGTFVPEAVLLRPEVRWREEGTYTPVDNGLTLYVCRNFACERPSTSWSDVIEHLRSAQPKLH